MAQMAQKKTFLKCDKCDTFRGFLRLTKLTKKTFLKLIFQGVLSPSNCCGRLHFQIDKNGHFKIKNFAKNKINCLYQSSYDTGA